MLEWEIVAVGEASTHADVVLGFDPGSGLITFVEVIDGAGSGGVAGMVNEVLARAPHPPRRLRVDSEAFAEQLRAGGVTLPIVVAPTAQAHEVARRLLGAAAKDDRRERVAPATQVRLVHAGAALWKQAPWELMYDSQVMRIDVPVLGLRELCLSIVGRLRQSFGLLVFESLDAFEAFGRAGQRRRRKMDLGGEVLSLTFDTDETPPVPVVDRMGRDGRPLPVSDAHVTLMSLLAETIATLFARNAAEVVNAGDEAFEAKFTDADGITVVITAPYVTDEELLAPDAADPPPRPASVRELDDQLIAELRDYAGSRFGASWRRASRDFRDAEAAGDLAAAWSVYGFRVSGKTVLQWFLDDDRVALRAFEHEWLDAQRRAWLGLWEVSRVYGHDVRVRELLSGELRSIDGAAPAAGLRVGDVVLARVVDHEGRSWFGGLHPRPLALSSTAGIVAAVRRKLRANGDAIAPEELRPDTVGRQLIALWEKQVAASEARQGELGG